MEKRASSASEGSVDGTTSCRRRRRNRALRLLGCSFFSGYKFRGQGVLLRSQVGEPMAHYWSHPVKAMPGHCQRLAKFFADRGLDDFVWFVVVSASGFGN